MANITLTNLPTVTGLTGSEPLLGVQSGASVQITTGQIVSLATGGAGALPLPVVAGGTGDTTLTAFGLMYGNGTNPVGVVSPPAGTNYVLVGSAGSAPSWQPTIPVTAGVDSIAFGTTGLTPSVATAGVITVAGTLAAKNGGTGQSSYTVGDLLYASSSTALSKLADVATGAVLISGGVGVAPSYSSSPTISGTTTSNFFIANGTISGSLSAGAYSYGTLPYSDVNIFASYQTSVNNYAQIILHNSSSGTTASTDIIVGNNNSTSTTFYGDFGMNSSGFTGTGALNAVNSVFLTSTSGDLAIGTTTANAIHFVVNSGATDAATISSAGVFSLGTALAVGSGGTGQSANWTQYGSIYASTTGVLASTATGTTGQPLLANTTSGPAFGNLAIGTANTNISGTLTITNGGTGQAAALTQYGIVYGASTTAMGITAAGTTGQFITATTAAAPSWNANINISSGALTIGVAGTTAGTLLLSGATSGTTTLAVAAAASGVLTLPSATTTLSGLNIAQTFTNTNTFYQIINTNNPVTVTSNAGTVPITYRLNTFTNSSAATMAITMAITSAVDGQMSIVRIYDFSAAAQTIGWTNTENSSVSVPTTSNGSTTLPLTVGFMYNSKTSLWRCIASA